jgi:hypothetical protein
VEPLDVLCERRLAAELEEESRGKSRRKTVKIRFGERKGYRASHRGRRKVQRENGKTQQIRP